MPDGLEKQVVAPPDPRPELVALQRTISVLQLLYVAPFMSSLVLIVANAERSVGSWGHYAWAITLGSAAATRLYRQSLVRKYNTIVSGGRPAPLI